MTSRARRCSRNRRCRAFSSAASTACSASGSACRGGCCTSSTSRTSAFAFLAAYLCYQLASVGGMDPLLTLALIVPLFFVLGVAVQWLLARFSVSPLNSLLATFGLTAIIEAGIQCLWTADFRKLESVYAGQKFRDRRAVRAGAGAADAGACARAGVRRSGPRCATRTSAVRCARSPRTRRSRRRSASTASARAAAGRAYAARWPASPAYASR